MAPALPVKKRARHGSSGHVGFVVDCGRGSGSSNRHSPPFAATPVTRPFHPLFPVCKARIRAPWTHKNSKNKRPAGSPDGSLYRGHRLAVAGRLVLREGRLLRQRRSCAQGGSAWAGKGAEALGLSGPVEPDAFKAVLEGKVPGGPHLGKRGQDGEIHHRPGRDVTLSAPKSVSLMALVGGDERMVAAHDRAVTRTLAWIERNAIETRMQNKVSGAMVQAGDQKMVAATFRHDTSRNLDPQLHTHAVIANMVQGGDGKWRTMVNDGLYRNKMATGAVYRAELAQGLRELGYGIGKTHADGRFEIEGVPREVIDAFSTRRAEIEAAMAERGLGKTADNPHLAARATLMTRAKKRDVDKGELWRSWERQAAELGFSAETVRAKARRVERDRPTRDLFAGPGHAAEEAANWAVEHLSERQAVFGHADLLAATLGREPGAVAVEAAERSIAELGRQGGLHAARGLDHGKHWTTDAALARESEAIALMRAGQGAERTVMRGWIAETKLRRGRLNEGQKEAVKLILSSKDRVVGVKGYAGTGKTTMLDRLRTLAESRGYRSAGLAPSASAARTLERESGIESETLQRFLARHAGIAEGRGTAREHHNLRGKFSKTLLVVDESSLASSEEMRGLRLHSGFPVWCWWGTRSSSVRWRRASPSRN